MDERTVEVKDLTEEILVRNHNYSVTSKVLKCSACLKIFNNSRYPNMALNLAYRAYCKNHNLLTSDEVSNFRHELRLSLGEISLLTGISPTTWSYYESGALIDPVHSHKIELIMTKKGMRIHLKDKTLPPELVWKVEKWL